MYNVFKQFMHSLNLYIRNLSVFLEKISSEYSVVHNNNAPYYSLNFAFSHLIQKANLGF